MTEANESAGAKHQTADGETVIVGGGIAGLVCGNYLVDAGREVTLLESAGEVGGRARSTAHGGFLFNLGPHAIYDAGAFAEILRDLEIEIDGGPPAEPFWGLADGELSRLPTGVWSMLRTDLFGFGETFSFGRLMMRIQGADPESESLVGMSARSWLAERTGGESSRRVAEAFVRLATYASDLARMPASLMVRQLQLSQAGVTYPDGGWQRLVDRLANRFQSKGGTLQCERPVVDVEPREDGAVEVATRNGDTLAASEVVLCVPPTVARALLDDELADAAGIPDDVKPVVAACLDLGLEELPCPERPLVLGLERPVYVSDHGRTARLTERDDATVVHAARYLRHAEELDSEAARAEIEVVLDDCQPGWRGRVVESRYLARMPVVSHMPEPDSGGLAGRPAPDVDTHDGLYLAGDWVGERGWLSNASAASGRRAASAILGRRAQEIDRRGGRRAG